MKTIEKAISIVTKTKTFFKHVKKEPLGPSLQFYLMILVIPLIISSFLELPSFKTEMISYGIETTPSMMWLFSSFFFFFNLFFRFVGLFLGVGILHIFVYLVGGKKGYTNTFKAVAYGSFPGLMFLWILSVPSYLGMAAMFTPFFVLSMFISIWVLLLETKGISVLHNIDEDKAFISVLIPFLISMLISIYTYYVEPSMATGMFLIG